MSEPLRVLIVEDSEDDTALLLRELWRGGYEPRFERVDTAAGMVAALGKETWDIVISDHAMPQFSSLAALKVLKESGLDLPFVIVSGEIGEDTAVGAMKAGAHDYIMKGRWARLVPAIKRELREAEIRAERKRAEEALRQAYDELEMRVRQRTAELASANEELLKEIVERQRAERFREEYVALISHDLSNPLTVVIGQAELVRRALDRHGLTSEAKMADSVCHNARRMKVLVQDLMETASLESGRIELRKEPTDLFRVISEIAERIGTPAERSHQRIRLEESERVPLVMADPQRLERAITNLLTNALKYSHPDSPVVVTISQRENAAMISVADSGVGIPVDDQHHLFQPFHRASNTGAREGLGLGLYITRLIAEAHGGNVCFESEVAKGSIFYVTLPLGYSVDSPRPAGV